MDTYDILKLAYRHNKLSKDDIYKRLVDGKITEQQYTEITGEVAELPLDVLKQRKLSELRKACNDAILAGFHSSVSGADILYGFDEQDQNNLTQQMVMIANGLVAEPIYWKGKGLVDLLPYTIEQFKQLCGDGQTHKLNNMMKYYPLKETVIPAATREELDAIVW
jgi:hypothetical protein